MSLIKRTLPTWPSLTDFFDDDWARDWFMKENASPAVNVVNNDSSYEIDVAAPGFKKTDFKIETENGVLTISGKSEKEEEEKKKNYTRREFSSSSFYRSFTLPEDVVKEGISAKYDDGVLKLSLKKEAGKASAKKKEIAVK
ncbi:Hsp20/alpha crystallin family protein [Reichenbachiella sp. MALMAid0571]|uniref:Hsp20/alpha crystallin family protein n=1 Tax=Reichenbachiella sp. MALMAid0571 TaxID=3143939 RepID=UPI0032DEFFDC